MGSDMALLWFWPIGPLAWERPCATAMALKSQKKEREGEKTKERKKKSSL